MNIKKIFSISLINLCIFYGLILAHGCTQQSSEVDSIGVVSIPPNEIKIDNEPDSSKGIKWGTNINELDGMKLVSKYELQLSDDKKNNDNLKVYTRVGDKLKIGDANIEKIYYFFYKNRFCRTLFYFNSTSDYYKIKETLFHAYGKIEVKEPTSYPISILWYPTYEWIGKKVNLVLRLSYYKEPVRTLTMPNHFNMNKQRKYGRFSGKLSISYNPIWIVEMEKDRRRKIEKGTADL